MVSFILGIRAFHPDRHAGDAAGSQRDRSRLHIRHQVLQYKDHASERIRGFMHGYLSVSPEQCCGAAYI